MPRKARIGAPGALHHVIAKGMAVEKCLMILNPLRANLVSDIKELGNQ